MAVSKQRFIAHYGGWRPGENQAEFIERCRRVDQIRQRCGTGEALPEDLRMLDELTAACDEEWREAFYHVRDPRRPEPALRYVYFAEISLRGQTLTKIGVTDNVEMRLKAHRRSFGTPLRLRGVMAWINEAGPHREGTAHIAERLIHDKFSREYVRTPGKYGTSAQELFRNSDRLNAFISAHSQTSAEDADRQPYRLERRPGGGFSLPVILDRSRREYR